MKLTFFVIILFVVSVVNVFSQDYWIYIRKQTKITDYNNAEQVAGFSDNGDIVEVVPCTSQYIPTKKEQELYKIIRVRDFTSEDKAQLKDTIRASNPLDEHEDMIIKYRRHKIDVSSLGIKEVFEKHEIEPKIKDKIGNKSIKFHSGK